MIKTPALRLEHLQTQQEVLTMPEYSTRTQRRRQRELRRLNNPNTLNDVDKPNGTKDTNSNQSDDSSSKTRHIDTNDGHSSVTSDNNNNNNNREAPRSLSSDTKEDDNQVLDNNNATQERKYSDINKDISTVSATKVFRTDALQEFVDENWDFFVGGDDLATKQHSKQMLRKCLRRNNRRELFNDAVFDKCFNQFGRWALTKELMVQFFKMVVPKLQKEFEQSTV